MSEEKISVDNPIQTPEEDRLHRAGIARFYADRLLELNADHGVVAGLFGSWGSGKTSFINMAKAQFKKKGATVIDFNPWMFGNTKKLHEKFFAELSAELKIHNIDDVGGHILQLGSLFLGGNLVKIDVKKIFNLTAGIVFYVLMLCAALSVAVFFVSNLSRELYPSPFQFRLMLVILLTILGAYVLTGLVEDLGKGFKIINPPDSVHKYQIMIKVGLKQKYHESGQPVIIILDDIDRLEKSEIMDIFRMIRLTAGFPHLIYVVIGDRFRIEQALEMRDNIGKNYLEKFIQIPYNLPIVGKDRLEGMLFEIFREVDPEFPFPYETQQVISKIILPLIGNVRDLRRYRNTIWNTFIDLQRKVASVDIFVLDALYMFAPDIYMNILHYANELTVAYDSENYMESGNGSSTKMDERQKIYSGMLNRELNDEYLGKEKIAAREQIIEALIEYTFPHNHAVTLSASSGVCYNKAVWEVEKFRNKRIAHRVILHLYLEGGYSLEYQDAERAGKIAECMKKENWSELDNHIQSISNNRLINVVKCLRYYDQEISKLHPSKINNSIVVLWNLLDRMPGDFLLEMYISTITDIFLYRLRDEAAVVSCIADVMSRIRSSFVQLHFLQLAAHRNVGYINKHPRISDKFQQYFNNLLSEIIIGKDPEIISEEYGLNQFLGFIMTHYIPSKPSQSIYNHIHSPRIILACILLYELTEKNHPERLTKNDLEVLKIKMGVLEEALIEPAARQELEMWFDRQYGGSVGSFGEVDNILNNVKQKILNKLETL